MYIYLYINIYSVQIPNSKTTRKQNAVSDSNKIMKNLGYRLISRSLIVILYYRQSKACVFHHKINTM